MIGSRKAPTQHSVEKSHPPVLSLASDCLLVALLPISSHKVDDHLTTMTLLRKCTVTLLLLAWTAPRTIEGQKDDLLFESPLYVLDVAGVSKVALHRNRAFLIVPSATVPLQEASWLPHAQHVSKLRKPPVNASVRRCLGLVRPVDLLVDVYKRLWVLDAGDDKCGAKLLVYDIMRNRLVESGRHVLQHGAGRLRHLAVDAGAARGAAMAYVAGGDKIFAYSLYQDRSWPLKTVIDQEITDLAVNQGGATTKATLLVLVNREFVYQILLSSVTEKETGVLEIGALMGPSDAGFISDGRGGVIYVLSRDFVAVKWNSNLALQAENQDILFQSDKVLYNVTSFAIDSNRNVWGVVNNGTNAMTWCAKLTLTGF